MQSTTHAAGDRIFTEGEPSQQVVRIVSGRVQVTKRAGGRCEWLEGGGHTFVRGLTETEK